MKMFKKICLVLLFFAGTIEAVEKLDEKYCVTYGNPEALIKVVEYFSFMCPQCCYCFEKDFFKIKEKYLQRDVYWIFHPNPLDIPTLEAMVCFSELNNQEKQLFLEAVLPHSEGESPKVITKLMKRAMEFLEQPVDQLNQPEFLQENPAFKAAFEFVSQKDKIVAAPTLEVDGIVYEEFPTFSFIKKTIERSLNS